MRRPARAPGCPDALGVAFAVDEGRVYLVRPRCRKARTGAALGTRPCGASSPRRPARTRPSRRRSDPQECSKPRPGQRHALKEARPRPLWAGRSWRGGARREVDLRGEERGRGLGRDSLSGAQVWLVPERWPPTRNQTFVSRPIWVSSVRRRGLALRGAPCLAAPAHPCPVLRSLSRTRGDQDVGDLQAAQPRCSLRGEACGGPQTVSLWRGKERAVSLELYTRQKPLRI